MEINDLTHTVIGCAFKVHKVLGAGFLEKVYENALKIELEKLDIDARQQEELPVWYESHIVGVYFPDTCGSSISLLSKSRPFRI